MNIRLHFALTMLLPYLLQAQSIIPIPDAGWHLWLDTAASWETDSIYLPDEVDLTRLPVNPPTSGWGILDSAGNIPVSLPSTVEEHFWGHTGSRAYNEEYYFEGQDTVVRNGNYLGVSWWWTDFDVPLDWNGKHVTLFIRGARLRAEVYLNRHLVGYNIITETSFTSDVTTAVLPGKRNRLAIRITNPGGRLDWLDTQLMTWGKTAQTFHKSHGFGGLDRGILLRAHDPIYIADAWVLNKPDITTIEAHLKIRNTIGRSANGTMKLELLEPGRANAVCATVEKKIELTGLPDTTVAIEITYRNATRWSNNSPTLYRLRATLRSHALSRLKNPGEPWKDIREVPFGFRWFEADGIGKNAVLRFNGNRIRITSAISWGFWGRNGLWPTPELAEREVRAAKTLGMNCIQFHRNVGKTEVLDAQDRLGLMRYMEPGGGQTSFGEKFSLYAASPGEKIDDSGKSGNAGTFAENYMEEKIVRMIRDHRSHPSLLLYCIQNEIHPDLRNPRIFRVLRRMHREDPSRIVVLKSGFPSGSPSVNQAWMQPYSETVHFDTGDGYSGWWDDHTVGGPGVWRDEMYRNKEDFTHRSTNDREIVMWGEMLGAAVPDNHAAMVRELKTGSGKSYDLRDHEEILAAYEKFLDRWGFRPAFPTAEALFLSIGNKSYDFWGRVIETARLAEANDYFVMSGWESTAIENHSGLVDNLRGFKGNPTLISDRLAPLRAVIRTGSLVYPTGTQPKIDLFLLNETHKPHATTMHLSVQTPGGRTQELGTFTVPQYQPDRFVYQTATSIQVPAFAQEGTYILNAEIVGQQESVTREKILAVDPAGSGSLPKRIGIVSSQQSLMKPFDFLPGTQIEPYHINKVYDCVIMADRFVRPPATETEPNTEIRGTDDDDLYRSINYGDNTSLEFIIPDLPKGSAHVTLKFAELFQDAEGMRVFDVALNGVTVLKDFDVFKAAGGKNIACDRTFTVSTPDGIVYITFPRVAKPSARICAIKVEAGDSVVAINCGGKEYKDKNGVIWRPYEPPVRISPGLLAKVKEGLPLIVLAEGEVATAAYAKELAEAGAIRYLGTVGDARASWMGSWYFNRDHPVYEGLPVNCGFDSYYQVPVTNSGGVLLEGPNVEVFAGYARDHDRNIGAASFSTQLGRGKIVFHSIPGLVTGLNGESSGLHPVLLKRLIANSILYVTRRP